MDLPYVIGIDPGKSGGIALRAPDGSIGPNKMPETEHDIYALLHDLALPHNEVVAYIEKLHVVPGTMRGANATFKLGVSYGFLRGMLVGFGIPFYEVTAQRWQRRLDCLSGGNKNITKAAAQRRWPSVKFIHATADASLIAEYGAIDQAARYGGS